MGEPFRYMRNVFKVGHSLAITIPIIWVKAMHLSDGDEVEIEAYADKLVLKFEEKCQKNKKA